MKTYILIIFTVLFTVNSFAQSETEWFPAQLNIQPFTANLIEPRAGTMVALGENQLRLDIGTSRDILLLKDGKTNLSFGADLFTYTRLRKENNFKFPVETIDFMFGINAGYKKLINKNEFGFRFRFSHISAHLVDGRFDERTGLWKDGRKPFVFSKEFFELFPYYKIAGFRVYIGLTYIIHIIPEEINKGVYQAGFDYYILPLRTKTLTPFIAYDFKLNGIEGIYSGNNIFKAGIKFGNPFSRGFSLLFSYISGKSIHGELFDLNENYFNFGFNLDL